MDIVCDLLHTTAAQFVGLVCRGSPRWCRGTRVHCSQEDWWCSAATERGLVVQDADVLTRVLGALAPLGMDVNRNTREAGSTSGGGRPAGSQGRHGGAYSCHRLPLHRSDPCSKKLRSRKPARPVKPEEEGPADAPDDDVKKRTLRRRLLNAIGVAKTPPPPPPP